MPTKKKLSKRKLTKLIWLMVSKRKYENHINVSGVVTGGTTESVLKGMIFAVSSLGVPYLKNLGVSSVSMMDMIYSSVRVVTPSF